MIGRHKLRIWHAALLCAGTAALFSGRAAHAQAHVVRNRYIRIGVNDADSRFTIVNQDGDPLTAQDDNLAVMFQDPATLTDAVKATLFVSSAVSAPAPGLTGIVGDTGTGDVLLPPTYDADGRSIISQWQFPTGAPDTEGIRVVVTQRISLVRDMARIEYRIENRGVGRVIGLRLAADVSDSAILDPATFEAPPGSTAHDTLSNPVFVPKQGLFSFETDFRPALPVGIDRNLVQTPIPFEWYTFAPAFDPFAFWKGVQTPQRFLDPATGKLTTGGFVDAVPPDRVVLAGQGPLVGGAGGGVDPLLPDFFYTVNPQRNILGPVATLGDVTVADFWGPTTLNSGQSRTVVTYIGVGVASHGLAGPQADPVFVGAIETDPQFSPGLANVLIPPLGVVRGVVPDFRLFGFAHNLQSFITVPGVTADLTLPAGLELTPATPNPHVDLGDLEAFSAGAANVEQFTFWSLHATGEKAGILPATVAYRSPLGSTTVCREINVPQGARYRFTGNLRMVSFPFTFQNPDPANALGLPSTDFTIVRWDPNANGGAGAYVPVFALRPGESYWIRTIGPRDVTLVKATPVDIPGGGLGPGSGTFGVNLSPNWNQVADPSPFAVVAKDLRILDPSTGAIVSFDDAVQRRFLLGSLWRFDVDQANYVQLQRDDYLNPGDGIWIFAARPLILLWPAPQGPQVT
jgi:hypothetical protein